MTGSARHGVTIALAVLAAVLVATTAWTGVQLFGQVTRLAGTAAPETPVATTTPTPTPTVRPETVAGIPIRTDSTLTVGAWMAEPWSDGRAMLYAPMSSDSDQAVQAGFDVTVYDEQGRILDRSPTHVGLLPGTPALARVQVRVEDGSTPASIVVEQTSIEKKASPYSGSITADELTFEPDAGHRVIARVSSTLDPAPEGADLYYVGYVDGAPIGLCWRALDLDAGGDVADGCYLQPVSTEPLERTEYGLVEVPEGAELKMFIDFDLYALF
ncbi:hypothetical protein Q9R19_00065 [Microbacterium sp. ARD32]|uniref:hypothetical protein n=1 Tax=Microbacterium sp. ARD32 TaxID=2962577 RepID=UPI002880D186|nr:hypothetical protein [Microbacterium sp. ARD32]MDT0156013.1 hypothetical protein [Microbacterium sp. ARD32]